MLQAGNHKVIGIEECFIGESKEKKTPYFCIIFKTESGELVPWQVYLHNNFTNDKAKEIAQKNMDTLVKIGYTGARVSDMADGNVADLFEKVDDDIYVVVEIEEFSKDDGSIKQRAVVKFVNVGNGYTKIDKKQAVVVLKSLSYDGWLTNSRKASPRKEKKAEAGVDSDDLLF